MKILMGVSTVDPKDSATGFILDLVKSLSKKVDHIYLIALQGENNNLPENITLFKIPKSNKIKKLFIFNKYVLQIISRYKPDLAFTHIREFLSINIGIWCKLFRKPHAFWYCQGQDLSYPGCEVNLRNRIALMIPNIILTGSEIIKNGYIKNYKIPEKKIKLIYHGVNFEKFKNPVKKLKKQGNPELLIVSRISPAKRIDTLIKAIPIIKKKYPNVLLNIIGKPSEFTPTQKFYEELKQLTQDLKLTENIKFLGEIPNSEISSYLHKCDLFITTGLAYKTTLEGIAAKKPIIMQKDCLELIFPELSEEQKQQISFEPQNPTDLANKILDHTDKPLNDNLYDLTKNKFDMPVFISRAIEEFNKLI